MRVPAVNAHELASVGLKCYECREREGERVSHAHIRRQFLQLYQDADGTMQCFAWQKDQKAVCHCLAAIPNLADDSNQDASWLNGLVKLSLSSFNLWTQRWCNLRASPAYDAQIPSPGS